MGGLEGIGTVGIGKGLSSICGSWLWAMDMVKGDGVVIGVLASL